ncbi:DeoR/GlpR family DNA-binding transcription regulator [Halomonas sp. WWR20]
MNGRSAARLEHLCEVLKGGGMIQLSEAARMCGVSEMTIRRDIAASKGTIVSLGGRLVMGDDPQFVSVYNLDAQKGRYAPAKQRLCKAAAALIEDGDTIFIDCGTTLTALATTLSRDISLTVVTYALNIVNAFNQRQLSNVRMILLGGLYYPASQSFGGQEMATAIRRLGINKAFFSAAGVHVEKGVSCFHFHEVTPKQAAIESAEQRILVVDESKLDSVRPAFFADLKMFDILLTNDEPGRALRERVQSMAGRDWPEVQVV